LAAASWGICCILRHLIFYIQHSQLGNYSND
jgi:hypothetical protein